MSVHPEKWGKVPKTHRKANPYNGWANYATWNVSLWVTSDEGAYNRLLFWKKGKHLDAASARDFVEDMWPNGTPDFAGEPERYDRVDWTEIADAFNEARGTERQENIGFGKLWSFTFEALPDDVEDRPGFNFLHAVEVPPVTFNFEPTYKHIADWLTKNGLKVSPDNVCNKDAIDQLGFFAETDDGKWFIQVEPGKGNPKLTSEDVRRLFPRPKREKNPFGPVFGAGIPFPWGVWWSGMAVTSKNEWIGEIGLSFPANPSRQDMDSAQESELMDALTDLLKKRRY